MAISDLAPQPDEKLVEALEAEQTKKPKDKKNKTEEKGTRLKTVRPAGRTGEGANVRTGEGDNERTPVNFLQFTIPKNRIRVRASFEMYQDQLEKLNGLEINAKLKGDKFSKSDIVRTALDKHLKKLSEQLETERVNARTGERVST